MKDKNLNFVLLILLVVVIALFVGFFLAANRERQDSVTTKALEQSGHQVKIGENVIPVEIADDEAERRQGLSDRESLPREKGMLFVMARREAVSFWMKDMHFPLDIVWIADGKVVGISENLEPEGSTPQRSYSSTVPVDHVLELNAGVVKEMGVLVGDGVGMSI